MARANQDVQITNIGSESSGSEREPPGRNHTQSCAMLTRCEWAARRRRTPARTTTAAQLFGPE
eukprot:7655909-Pyramimonas_sp.AAC.1